MRYLTQNTKNLVVAIAGCHALCETLLEQDFSEFGDVTGDIMAMRDCAFNVLQSVEKGMDPDQLRGLARYASNHTLAVQSVYSPDSGKDYYTISQDAMDRLLQDVIGDCAFCDKDAHDTKKCQRRRDLLECGIIGSEEALHDCPYKT